MKEVIKKEDMSPLQKQVWDREIDYWKFTKAHDINSYMDLWHPEVKAWPEGALTPIDKKGLREGGLKSFEQFKKDQLKYEIFPMQIAYVDDNDDVAVVYYRAEWQQFNGKVSSIKIIHTWKKVNGVWLILGGTSALINEK